MFKELKSLVIIVVILLLIINFGLIGSAMSSTAKLEKEHQKQVDKINKTISDLEKSINELEKLEDSLENNIKSYENEIDNIRASHDQYSKRTNRQLKQILESLR